GVKHHREADEEDPRTGDVDAGEPEFVALDRLHPGDAADGHEERASGADERPRAGVDDVVIVIFGVAVGHGHPPILAALGASPSAPVRAAAATGSATSPG